MDIGSWITVGFVLAVLFWDRAKFIIIPLIRLVMLILKTVFDLVFGKPKHKHRNKNFMKPVKRSRKKRRSTSVPLARAQANLTQPLTRSNPWASGNPGQPVSAPKPVKPTQPKRREADTPPPETVKDRASSLPDDTVIMRRERPDDTQAVLKSVENLPLSPLLKLNARDMRQAFLIKELLDKPRALREGDLF